MPGLVPLLLTFGCMWLLRRKVNRTVDYYGLLRYRYLWLLDWLLGTITLAIIFIQNRGLAPGYFIF